MRMPAIAIAVRGLVMQASRPHRAVRAAMVALLVTDHAERVRVFQAKPPADEAILPSLPTGTDLPDSVWRICCHPNHNDLPDTVWHSADAACRIIPCRYCTPLPWQSQSGKKSNRVLMIFEKQLAFLLGGSVPNAGRMSLAGRRRLCAIIGCTLQKSLVHFVGK